FRCHASFATEAAMTDVLNAVETARTEKTPYDTHYDNFIGGKWTPPRGGRYFDNPSPVDAAHAAKDSWGRTSATERAVILNRIADRMEQNLDLLAAAETWDNGKPI